MNSKWLKQKEYLENAILNEKRSYESLGKEFGCSGKNIKEIAVRLGIDIPNRKSRKICTCIHCGKEFIYKSGYSNKFCCVECEKTYKHKQLYLLILNGDPSIMRANYQPKNFKDDILEEQGGVCAICGMKPEWNGKELIFILDHIDGHASNNKRDNLRCICPNCDSQLETYKSKNKFGDRYYYRYGKDRGQVG